MILEKLEEQRHFTDTEISIANYLINPSNSIIGLTTSELGKVTYTSQAAIVRLYKKLGANNYRTFIMILSEELTERKRTSDIDYAKPIDAQMSIEEITTSLPKLYSNIISNTNLILNRNVIQRIYNRISSAKMIDIYGIGIAYSLAEQLTFKLQTIGLPCRSFCGINQIYVDMSQSKKETIAIVFSFTGENKTIIDIAVELRKQNIYTFALIGKTNSILETICNDYIVFDPNYYNKLDTLSSVFAAQYIIDVIYSMFISHNYKF